MNERTNVFTEEEERTEHGTAYETAEARAEYGTVESRPSIAGLFTDLMSQTTCLVQNELRLAKAEMSQKVSQVQSAMMSFVMGAVFALASLMILLAAAVIGLTMATDWPAWLSALVVGAVVGVVALVLLMSARRNIDPENLKLHATAESIRKDKHMIKEQAR